MQVQQVSLKNNVCKKYNQQNINLNLVVPKFAGSIKETNNFQKNKTLKYLLITAGTLMTIITAINYKKITKLFKKLNESTSIVNSHPKKLEKNFPMPVENILRAANVENAFIQKSKNKGYQLWHFTSEVFLKNFVNAHEDILKLVKADKQKEFIFNSIKSIQKNSEDKDVQKFINAVKEKTGVNLLEQIKHYRFIGKSEFNVIKSKQPVINSSYHGYSYVTLCPDFGLSVNTFDYRITYKNTQNVLKNLDYYHDTQYKSGIKKPYSYLDIEKVEKLVKGQWQEVKF